MLATSPWTNPFSFLPPNPSPLSPRRHSTSQIPRSSLFPSMPTPSSNQTTQPIFNQPIPTSTSSSSSPTTALTAALNPSTPPKPSLRTPQPRPSRPAISQTSLSARRRALFHNRIRSDRDDKSWSRRGEELARLDDRNERRRWEAERRSELENLGWRVEQLESALEGEGEEEGEVDDVARREWEEVQALVSLLPVEGDCASTAGVWGGQLLAEGCGGVARERDHGVSMRDDEMGQRDDTSSLFGSDDEEYEKIFGDMLDGGTAQGEEMDLS